VLAAYFLAQWSPLEGSTIILSNNTVKAIEVKQ